jgi:hypothetical protein
MYTDSGFVDAAVIQFDMNGKIRKGQFFSLKSQLNLARGLFLLSDGSVIFAGNTKKVLSHNYQY